MVPNDIFVTDITTLEILTEMYRLFSLQSFRKTARVAGMGWLDLLKSEFGQKSQTFLLPLLVSSLVGAVNSWNMVYHASTPGPRFNFDKSQLHSPGCLRLGMKEPVAGFEMLLDFFSSIFLANTGELFRFPRVCIIGHRSGFWRHSISVKTVVWTSRAWTYQQTHEPEEAAVMKYGRQKVHNLFQIRTHKQSKSLSPGPTGCTQNLKCIFNSDLGYNFLLKETRPWRLSMYNW